MKSTFWMTAQETEDELKRRHVTRSVIVKRIEDEGDRILLWGDDNTYHVIARAGCPIKVGDRMTYEPCGMNFGWLVEEQKS